MCMRVCHCQRVIVRYAMVMMALGGTQGTLPEALDNCVRDMGTMQSVAASLVQYFRQADEAARAGTSAPTAAGVNTSDADALCRTTLTLLAAGVRVRCHVRGRIFVELLVRLLGTTRQLVGWLVRPRCGPTAGIAQPCCGLCQLRCLLWVVSCRGRAAVDGAGRAGQRCAS